MDKQKELGEGSVIKLLTKYSVPAIIAMMVNSLYTIIDRMFIGRIPGVGSIAMSGVGITMPIVYIVLGLGMLVGVGTAASISIKLGQGKKKVAEKLLGNALTLSLIISVIVTILGIMFSKNILLLFGASSSVIGYADQFIKIILIGTVFNLVGFSLNQSIRSDGSPKVAMTTMLIGCGLNIALDPLFIFVFKWGIQGAALATILSQAVSAVCVLYYFTKGSSNLKIKKETLKLEKPLVLGIFAIGMAPCAMQMAASLVQVVSNRALITYGGDLAAGVMAIISSVGMIFLMPIFGMNQGSQPIIGYNYGAKKYKRVKQTLIYAIIAATIVVAVGGILIQLFPDIAIKMFNDDPKLIEIGVSGIKIYLAMLPIIGFQAISTNYFQAVGKAKTSMFLSLLRQVILLIPLLIILPKYFGLTGVWLAGPTSDLLSSIITAIFITREMNLLEGVEKEELVA
ncbi:MATE family efflux transporter [Clostridium massiliamazoniense]|uniref:MATE family efflux transporter n=1 Tax=Clostridium massiliamazoniense TaxID=1347366 RepID=UPI0006D83096|nr:MATE family efflux transporter [Clostridium massiliamazoniense]